MQRLRDVLDSNELDFRFELGISDVSSTLELTDCSRIVDALATHCTVVKVKVKIDQIVEGLQILGVHDLMQANPHTMHKLFTSQTKPLTAELMIKLFEANLLPDGSNTREDEEQVMLYWNHFLELIECKAQ